MAQRSIGPYSIEASLGVGTVGTVYRARDRAGRVVALKVLHPGVSADENISARFRREMMILEKLSHPHIVEYYGGGKDDGQLYYAMELVDGGSIKLVLQESGRLSWEEAASCGIQVASALQHAHNHGIVHRDLKPANLFLTRDGKLKLGDFGIARDLRARDLTMEGQTVGTYAYMAPEQIVGDRSISGKTDLYALGCLLFEMLAGRPPYLGDTFPQLFDQHLRSEPPRVGQFAPDCPREIEDLILSMLSKDIEGRPFNARTVQGVLMELLDTTAQREGVPEDERRRFVMLRGSEAIRRRLEEMDRAADARDVSWLSLAALLLFVVGLAGAAWWLAV